MKNLIIGMFSMLLIGSLALNYLYITGVVQLKTEVAYHSSGCIDAIDCAAQDFYKQAKQ